MTVELPVAEAEPAPPALAVPERAPVVRLPVRWRRTGSLLLLALLTAGLMGLAMQFPARTEVWYSEGVYPWIAGGLVAISGWLPFSLGEVLLLTGLGAVLVHGARGAVGVLRRRRPLGNVLARLSCHAVATASVLATLFVLLWGLNHARQPFAARVGLLTRPVSKAALTRTAEALAQRAAAARPPGFDARAGMPRDWIQRVAAAYVVAGRRWPVLQGPRPPLRSPWISPLLTLGSITGIYSPFTGEPHVNADIPAPEQLFTACHEVAHLRGFAREDEANFIAWWVGSRAADPVLAYACELMAFRYAMGALGGIFGVDPAAARRIRESVPEVMQDVHVLEEFWDRQPPIQHAVTKVATITNDIYLKSTGHKDGVRSYGRMVDLLVAALGE